MNVRIYHWWPGRKWAGPSPIPDLERSARGSRYMTVARLHSGDQVLGVGVARCCDLDVPSRKLGREIAIGRMWKDARKRAASQEGAHD